jgi:hypothetical protein
MAAPAMLCFVAAAALLPSATSTPACDCEAAVVLERQRLQAEHTVVLQALEKMHGSRITELEGLVAALGLDANDAARDAVPKLALLHHLTPRLHQSEPRDQPAQSFGGRLGGELRKSTSSRALLQTEKFCSMDEFMSLQQETDVTAAVIGMLTTNEGCAICLIPCGSAENALGCAMACVKQVLPITRALILTCLHLVRRRCHHHRRSSYPLTNDGGTGHHHSSPSIAFVISIINHATRTTMLQRQLCVATVRAATWSQLCYDRLAAYCKQCCDHIASVPQQRRPCATRCRIG